MKDEITLKVSEQDFNISFIPTGLTALDGVLGGGIPTRKIVEFAGAWSIGKSSLGYQLLTAAQKDKRPTLLIDAERAYTPQYGALMGIDNDSLDLYRAQTAEEYLDMIFFWLTGNKEMGIKKHKGGVIVVDAVGALLPREESEKPSEGKTIGAQSRLIGSFCRKIVPVLDDNDAALIFLNHTFNPISPFPVASQSSGGKKLEYARSVWIVMSKNKGKKSSSDGTLKSIPTCFEVRKNKIVSNQGLEIEMDFIPSKGFVDGVIHT